jgi:hypothetical protein
MTLLVKEERRAQYLAILVGINLPVKEIAAIGEEERMILAVTI